MKTSIRWLFTIFTLFISCGCNRRQAPENRLEKYFEKYVVIKQYVHKIDSTNTFKKDAFSYYIGYDTRDRIVNNGNYQFYEYDSLGRISKEYQCMLYRDPTCSRPHIFIYEYANGNISKIKRLNNIINDSIPYEIENFIYDSKNRLIQHIKYSRDTFTYTYIGDDTFKHSELRIYWVNDANNNTMRVPTMTTFQYDSLGRKISQTSSDSVSDISRRNDFFYDSNNRLVMIKDTSLDEYLHVPNSCCILYWTNYKYDDQGRLIEEKHSTGSYDNPNPAFQRSTKFQY